MLVLCALACHSNRIILKAPSTPTPLPIISLNELQFTDPETGQRFLMLNHCIQEIVDDTWRQIPYYTGGNFYKSGWCRGSGSGDDCQIAAANVDNRDQQIFRLYTLFYPQRYPEVFGLGFQFLWVPKSTGWGVNFSFNDKGEGVVGSSWSAIIKQYMSPTGSPEATVYLGSSYVYKIYSYETDTHFRQYSDLPLREDLAIYLSGSEAMRDRVMVQNQALAQKVISAINAHEINTCDWGPYQGKGIPPECTPRPLTPDEEREELAKAEAYFAEQEQLLINYYQEIYETWMMIFPFEECWP